MNNWFECIIKHETVDSSGTIVSAQSKVIINSTSYTDVENKLSLLKGVELPEEFFVTNIKKAFFEDIIIQPDPEYWFRAKVIFLEINEKNGKPKKTPKFFLVPGSDFISSTTLLNEYIKNHYITDSYIHTISLTNITYIVR